MDFASRIARVAKVESIYDLTDPKRDFVKSLFWMFRTSSLSLMMTTSFLRKSTVLTRHLGGKHTLSQRCMFATDWVSNLRIFKGAMKMLSLS